MLFRNLSRIILPLLLIGSGVWLVGLTANPAPESVSRQEAIQAFAPAGSGIVEAGDQAVPVSQLSVPYTVNMRGEIDLVEQDVIVSAA